MDTRVKLIYCCEPVLAHAKVRTILVRGLMARTGSADAAHLKLTLLVRIVR